MANSINPKLKLSRLQSLELFKLILSKISLFDFLLGCRLGLGALIFFSFKATLNHHKPIQSGGLVQIQNGHSKPWF